MIGQALGLVRSPHARKQVRRRQQLASAARPAVEGLEGRRLLAADITIIAGAPGSGTLDHFLGAANGTITTADDPGDTSATLSTGALQGVGTAVAISIAADSTILFNDIGTLGMQSGAGVNAGFQTTTGPISFANTANTVTTSSGSLTFTAGTNLTVGNLNTSGGDVSLTAGTADAGNLQFANILTSGSGNLTFQATNAAGGSITQAGNSIASGLAIGATATGNINVNALRGTTVALTSNTGSVSSTGSFAVQASAQLTLSAATGITLNTLAASLQVSNTTSGNIEITQVASPAQTLSITGTGVVNSAPGGTVSVTNLGASVAISSGVVVESDNGDVTLAGTDLQINGPVISGTTRTTLSNSTAGRPIDIGTDTPGTIGLTQAELNEVTAGVLQIGSNTAGNINVSAAITNPATWNVLSLINGGSVTEGAAGSLTLPNLRISSTGPVTLDNTNNNVGNLAASTTNSFLIDNATNTLTIPNAGVDGVLGVTTNNSNITLIADNILIKQVVTPGTGTVLLEPFTTTLNMTVGTASVAGSTFGITNGGLGWITSGLTQVGVAADTGTIAITGAINRTPTATAPSRSQTLDLVTGNTTTNPLVGSGTGAVTQTAPLSVANLAAQAVGGVQLTNAGNDVDTVAGSVTGGTSLADNFRLVDTPSVAGTTLSVGTVAAVAGITVAGNNFLELTITGALTLTNGLSSSLIGLNASGAVMQGAGAGAALITTASGIAHTLELLGAGPYSLINSNNSTNRIAASVTDAVIYTNAGALTLDSFNYSDNFGGTVAGVTTTSGAIAINTVAGDLTVSFNVTAGGSNLVSLTAGSTVASPEHILTNNATISGPAGVTLTADRMALQGGTIKTGGSSIVTLTVFSAGRTVNLGGTTDPTGTLTLSQAELNTITTDILNVGDLVNTGAITLTAPITDATTGFTTLSLSGAAIGQNSGDGLTVTSLAAQAATGITLNDSSNNIANLAAYVSGTGDAFSVSDDTHTLTIPNAGVDGVLGVTTNDAGITLQADNISIKQVVTPGLAADITDTVLLEPFTATLNITLGTASVPGSTFGITNGGLGWIISGITQVGTASDTGAIAITGAINRTPTATAPTRSQVLYLVTGNATASAISQTAALSVANLAVQPVGGVVLTNAANTVGTLAFHTTSGNVQFTNTGGVTIASVAGLTTSSAGGTVTLNESSPITFAVNTTSSGTLSATTTETPSEASTPLPEPDDDITINSGVTVESTGGDVDLTSGDSIIAQAGAHIISETGAVNLNDGVGDDDNDAILDTINATAAGSAISGVEGASTGSVVVATFTDADGGIPAGSYTATINWGDGSSSPGSISLSSNIYTVTASHTFNEEGTYSPTIVINRGSDTSNTVTDTVNVSDPPVSASPAGTPVQIVEGNNTGPLNLATFTDPGGIEPLADYSSSIAWGDGTSSPGSISLLGSTFTVSSSGHTFAEEGTFSPVVTISHEATMPQVVTDTGLVTVADAKISAAGVNFTGQEGRTFTGTVATFTDAYAAAPLSDFTATINWGDGHTTAGTIASDGGGHFHVTGSHAYAEELAKGYSVSVSIHDVGGSHASASSTGKISDSPLDQLSGKTFTVSANTAFSDKLLGTFRDQDALNTDGRDYNATIHWGDGTTSSPKIDFNGATPNVGSFWDVFGNHKYATRKTYTVTIDLHDLGSPLTNYIITAFIKVM